MLRIPLSFIHSHPFYPRSHVPGAGSIEQVKLLSGSNAYVLGRLVRLQGWVYHQQGKLEDATSEALRALEIFEKLGAPGDANHCRALLGSIQGATSSGGISDETVRSFYYPAKLALMGENG